MRRVTCPEHEVVTEKVPWSDGKHTQTVEQRQFLANWARRLSWSEVAECLATIIWHMLRWGKPYQFRYDPPAPVKKRDGRRPSGKVLGGMDNNHHKGKKTKTPLTGKTKTKACPVH